MVWCWYTSRLRHRCARSVRPDQRRPFAAHLVASCLLVAADAGRSRSTTGSGRPRSPTLAGQLDVMFVTSHLGVTAHLAAEQDARRPAGLSGSRTN
jgi:hypothetical protein